jgi:four helix bundle protein
MKNYKELHVWKKGIELVKITYQLSKKFPSEEKFGLVSQMTRAAVSIPANIAEGSSRNSDKDYARFLQIALGSAFELQTYFVIGKEMGWLSELEIKEAEKILEEEIKMIHAFIKQLANS